MPASIERFQAVLTLLRLVDKNLLLNREFLVSIIRAAGIHPFGPYDPFAQEGGLMLQDPHQFADALITLSRYRCNRLIEVGTWAGHTGCFLTAFLQRYNPEVQTLCVDVLDVARNSFGLPITFLVGTSDIARDLQFDLAFIDGDHTFPWIERDYQNVGARSPVCVFHDIDNADFDMLDPGRFWEDLKQREPGSEFFEFKYPGKHFMGIGVRIKPTVAVHR
ncbi:MAG TPA: class I SAM-dependent methyltransferase [Pirellulales bacterium]|nr:class I SAM-dependent methyltransferase [Pirellulales bacterium]